MLRQDSANSRPQTIVQWRLDGAEVKVWPRVRAADMDVTPDGSRLVVACFEHKVSKRNVLSKNILTTMTYMMLIQQ